MVKTLPIHFFVYGALMEQNHMFAIDLCQGLIQVSVCCLCKSDDLGDEGVVTLNSIMLTLTFAVARY